MYVQVAVRWEQRGIHSRLELWRQLQHELDWFHGIAQGLVLEGVKRKCDAQTQRAAKAAQLCGKGMEKFEKKLRTAMESCDDALTEERRIELLVHAAHTERRERDRVVKAAEEELAAWQLLVFEVMEATGAMQAVAAKALEEADGSVSEAASLVLTWEDNRRNRASGKRPRASK